MDTEHIRDITNPHDRLDLASLSFGDGSGASPPPPKHSSASPPIAPASPPPPKLPPRAASSDPCTRMLAWLTSHGALYPLITFPATHPTQGYRCALASATIPANTPCMSIPYSCMLNVATCLREPLDELGRALRGAWKEGVLRGDELLALLISREVVLGKESRYGRWEVVCMNAC